MSSMSSQPNVTLPDPILAAAQEAAEREHKTLNEMVGELVMIGLQRQGEKKSPLNDLLEYGHKKAVERFGKVPSEDEVVNLVHAHRHSRRR